MVSDFLKRWQWAFYNSNIGYAIIWYADTIGYIDWKSHELTLIS